MTTAQVLLIVGVFVIVDLVVVFAAFRLCAIIWNALGKGCDFVQPGPDAVRKDFQSMKIGMFNYGGCLHIAVDEDYLHLYPAWIVRTNGGRSFSVPWERVQADASHPKRRVWRGRINGQKVLAPAWAMKIAAVGVNVP